MKNMLKQWPSVSLVEGMEGYAEKMKILLESFAPTKEMREFFLSAVQAAYSRGYVEGKYGREPKKG